TPSPRRACPGRACPGRACPRRACPRRACLGRPRPAPPATEDRDLPSDGRSDIDGAARPLITLAAVLLTVWQPAQDRFDLAPAPLVATPPARGDLRVGPPLQILQVPRVSPDVLSAGRTARPGRPVPLGGRGAGRPPGASRSAAPGPRGQRRQLALRRAPRSGWRRVTAR